MPEKNFDLVIFGATSFVGKILVHYLAKTYGFGGDLKWAIAGRSASKLKELKSEIELPDLPKLVVDANSRQQLDSLAKSAKVIATTVGPYALYGSDLVAACVANGTDYCDLTGEVQWIAKMLEAYEAQAKKSGARIVHCCGFDSIPSDLGVHFLQDQAIKKFKQPCQTIKMRVRRLKGEFSGGTVASMINVTKEIKQDPSLRKKMANPYFIAPSNLKVRQPNVNFAQFDKASKSWVAPFVMASINTRVVHRSNALSGYAYGKDFIYDEAMMTGTGLKGRSLATAMTLGMGAFLMGLLVPPSRWVLERFVVPKPGEGPSPRAQELGHYDLRFYGETADGQKMEAQVTGDRDPGYGSTGKMLGEAAVCLAKDKLSTEGGFWTPSTLMGGKLRTRLIKNAGLRFEIVQSIE